MLAFLIGGDRMLDQIRRLFGSTVAVRPLSWPDLDILMDEGDVPELVIVNDDQSEATRNGIRWLGSAAIPTVVIHGEPTTPRYPGDQTVAVFWPARRDDWWAAVVQVIPDTLTLNTPSLRARKADVETATATLDPFGDAPTQVRLQHSAADASPATPNETASEADVGAFDRGATTAVDAQVGPDLLETADPEAETDSDADSIGESITQDELEAVSVDEAAAWERENTAVDAVGESSSANVRTGTERRDQFGRDTTSVESIALPLSGEISPAPKSGGTEASDDAQPFHRDTTSVDAVQPVSRTVEQEEAAVTPVADLPAAVLFDNDPIDPMQATPPDPIRAAAPGLLETLDSVVEELGGDETADEEPAGEESAGKDNPDRKSAQADFGRFGGLQTGANTPQLKPTTGSRVEIFERYATDGRKKVVAELPVKDRTIVPRADVVSTAHVLKRDPSHSRIPAPGPADPSGPADVVLGPSQVSPVANDKTGIEESTNAEPADDAEPENDSGVGEASAEETTDPELPANVSSKSSETPSVAVALDDPFVDSPFDDELDSQIFLESELGELPEVQAAAPDHTPLESSAVPVETDATEAEPPPPRKSLAEEEFGEEGLVVPPRARNSKLPTGLISALDDLEELRDEPLEQELRSITAMIRAGESLHAEPSAVHLSPPSAVVPESLPLVEVEVAPTVEPPEDSVPAAAVLRTPQVSRPSIWVIDNDPFRLEFALALLADAQPSVFRTWLEADLLIQSSAPPQVVLLGVDCLTELGDARARTVDETLSRLGVATVITYSNAESVRISLLRQYSEFTDFVLLPEEEALMPEALLSLLPDLKLRDVAGLQAGLSDTDGVDSGAALMGPEDWLDLDALVTLEQRARVVADVPSLTAGVLETLPLARLLHLMSVQRRSGELCLRHRGHSIRLEIDDGRIGSRDGPRGLEQAYPALGWTEGEFDFSWKRVSPEHTRTIADFVFEGICHTEQSQVLHALANLEKAYPVFTTQLLGRAGEARRLGEVWNIALECMGREPLSALIREGSITLEQLQNELVYCLATDMVVLLSEPSDAPAGMAYRLHGRLSDVETVAPLDFGEQPPGGFVPQPTRGQIAGLNLENEQLLEHLEALMRMAFQSDPYALFELEPGCGVADAADRLLEFHADLPSPASVWGSSPLRVTLSLLHTAITNAYHLVLADETGFGLRIADGDVPTLTHAEATVLTDLELRLTALSQRPYRAFRLPAGCGVEAVEDRFEPLLREYHPDRTHGTDPLVTHIGGIVFASFIEAFQRLVSAEEALATSGQSSFLAFEAEMAAQDTDDDVVLESVMADPGSSAIEQLATAERSLALSLTDMAAIREAANKFFDEDDPDEEGVQEADRFLPTEVPDAPTHPAPAVRAARRPSVGADEPIVPGKSPAGIVQKPSRPPTPPRPVQAANRIPVRTPQKPVAEGADRVPIGRIAPKRVKVVAGERQRGVPIAPPRRSNPVARRPVLPPRAEEELPPAKLFAEGKKALARNFFTAARENFERAAVQEPENGDFIAHLAWATLLCHPDRVDSAREDLERALQLDGGAESASFFLGTLALRNDEFKEAVKLLSRTMKLNPRHAGAERALRLARSRLREEDASVGGFFGKLFKK